MLIPIPAFKKTCIVISSCHFCHELCIEHSRKNIFIKGIKLCSYRFRPSKRPASSSLLVTSVMNCAWKTLLKMSSLKDSSAHCDSRTSGTPASSSVLLTSLMKCAWKTLSQTYLSMNSSFPHRECETSRSSLWLYSN